MEEVKTKKEKKTISIFKCSYSYIFKNILSVAIVCIICLTFVQLAISGYLECMFRLACLINGEPYIAANNIFDYIKNPIIILIILTYLIILTCIFMFQVGVFIYTFNESKNKRKVNFIKMLNFGFYAIKKLFKPKNWFIFLFVLLLLPVADLLNLTYYNMSIVIPGFIKDFILNNAVLKVFYYIFFVALFAFVLLSALSFHYFLLDEDISFFKAVKKSVVSIAKNTISGALSLLLIYLVFFGIIAIVCLIIVLLMCLFRGKMYSDYAFVGYYLSYFSSLSIILLLPISFSFLSSYFYSINKNEEYTCEHKTSSKLLARIRNISFLSVIVIFAGVDIILNIDNYKVFNELSYCPSVVAHRGSSVSYPENTMPAFKAAIDEGADMIELDIHQTKDKVLIVCHDDNLKRISGKDIYVYDYTYEELKNLDVGSYYSSEYEGLKLSTLEEVLIASKGKIDLMIEIKPTKHDDHLEEDLISLINKYDMRDQVLVHSLKDAPLKRMKELDPTIKVAYCMVVAINDIDKIDFADEYTVEESYITPELVRRVHASGKKIYVWTINSTDNIQYLIDCGVDGLIGDNPILLWQAIFEANYDTGFSKALRMFSLNHFVM